MTRPAKELALSCIDLTASYGPIVACNGISLELHARERLLILGPNGAGKSSFFGAVAGLVRSGGEVRLRSARLDGMTVNGRVVCGLAFVPEIRGNVFRPLSVRENLDIALHPLASRERGAARDYLLDLFPALKERYTSHAGNLSGGEQQMLAIAMAVARDPAVLMLDEPSQGLAPAIYDTLIEVFDRLTQRGISIVIAEQNISFGARCAERYVVLSGGRVVSGGTTRDLADHQDIIDQYFQ